MKKIAFYASLLGVFGVLIGAFGAHGVKGKISDYHYGVYRVGVEYLFFHLAPLFYIAMQQADKKLKWASGCFITGIVFFAGSNLLMSTEAIHRINFHYLWPVTPLGGILMVIGWILLAFYLLKNED